MARIILGAQLVLAGAVLSLLALAGASWFSAVPIAPAVSNSPASTKAVSSVAHAKANVVKAVLKTSDRPLWS